MPLGSFTCDLEKRPFVKVDDAERATLYPFPNALIDRVFVDGPACNTLALRLFHALHFVAWNTMDVADNQMPLAHGSKILRSTIGRSGQSSNSDLRAAFRVLTECQFALPAPDSPDDLVTAPLLDWQHIDREGRAFWAFSEPVQTWCSRPGSTYAWLDLRVTTALSNVAALRLYELGSALVLRDHKTLRVVPSDLRAYLDAADTYPTWSDFDGKLVAKSIDQVNAHAAFTIGRRLYSAIAHRSVDAVILSVTPNPNAVPSTTPLLHPLRLEDVSIMPLPEATPLQDFQFRHSSTSPSMGRSGAMIELGVGP